MKKLNINSNQLVDLIRDIAQQELLPRFNRVSREFKSDGSIVTEADIITQQRITSQLMALWPNTELLGEEMSQEQQTEILKSDKPIWCLDPLDGTSNFSAGIPYFAISLSLIFEAEVVLGLIYDPIRDECFLAQKEGDEYPIATLNNERLTLGNADISLSKATAIIDFKRLTDELATRIVVERPISSQRNFGASALDWCWLAAGRGHVYLHGSQNLWDYAAGDYIFRAAGGHCCTLENEPVYINQLKKRSIIAATDAKLFSEWCSWIDH